MEKEVESYDIGELIMTQLKDIDEVAYVRFASVYRQFTDVSTFVKEIEKLIGPAPPPPEKERRSKRLRRNDHNQIGET